MKTRKKKQRSMPIGEIAEDHVMVFSVGHCFLRRYGSLRVLIDYGLSICLSYMLVSVNYTK